MKRKVELRAEFTEYESALEVSESDHRLIELARKSTQSAYAPYSNFHVGAALLLEDGTLIIGNNQENASYSLGVCAERVALFTAGANYPDKRIIAMAITAQSNSFVINRPIAPCGACRQVIAEYEHRQKSPIRLLLTGTSGTVLAADSIEGLLPMQFTADDLEAN